MQPQKREVKAKKGSKWKLWLIFPTKGEVKAKRIIFMVARYRGDLFLFRYLMEGLASKATVSMVESKETEDI